MKIGMTTITPANIDQIISEYPYDAAIQVISQSSEYLRLAEQKLQVSLLEDTTAPSEVDIDKKIQEYVQKNAAPLMADRDLLKRKILELLKSV